MSVIFQTEPPSVHTHLLPKDAKFFTYKVNNCLKIYAWLPDGYKTIHQRTETSNDEFYEQYCEGCIRNCYSYLNDKRYEDDDEVDWDLVPGGEANHCYVYDDGYTGQKCPEGIVEDDYDLHLKISDMVFQIGLECFNTNYPFLVSSDRAYLCSGYYDEVEKQVYSTDILMASNVFGDVGEIGNICWGSNNTPNNLRSMVNTYFNSQFNSDLLPVDKFESNCEKLRELKSLDHFSRDSTDKFLCYGEDADAVVLLHAEKHIPAFFTMLSAGFKPIEHSEFLMIIPAKEFTVEKDDSTYYGYVTIPDAVGKRWFISQDNLLIGQI